MQNVAVGRKEESIWLRQKEAEAESRAAGRGPQQREARDGSCFVEVTVPANSSGNTRAVGYS